MRNKNFDADLLKTLNEQPMPAAPLQLVLSLKVGVNFKSKKI